MSEATNPNSDSLPHQAAPPRNNTGWIAFFAFIIIASVGVAGFMIWFNLSIQLTPEKLDEAWHVWKEKGPKNYNMVYTKRLNDDAKVDRFAVEVRGGEVKKVTMNGRPLRKDAAEDEDPLPYHSVDRLFHDIERFMEMDQKPGAKRVYVTAIFDDKNGCVRKYIRRVMGETVRIELHVTLETVE